MKNPTKPFTEISNTLTTIIGKLFKAGSLALILGFIRLLSLAYAFYLVGKLYVPVFIVGSIFILTGFGLFLFIHNQLCIKSNKTLKVSMEIFYALKVILFNPESLGAFYLDLTVNNKYTNHE